MEPKYKIGDKVLWHDGYLPLGIITEVIETDKGNFYHVSFSNHKNGVVSEKSLEPYKLIIQLTGTRVYLIHNNQILRSKIQEIRDTRSLHPRIHYGIKINNELIKFEPQDIYRTEEDILHYLKENILTQE